MSQCSHAAIGGPRYEAKAYLRSEFPIDVLQNINLSAQEVDLYGENASGLVNDAARWPTTLSGNAAPFAALQQRTQLASAGTSVSILRKKYNPKG